MNPSPLTILKDDYGIEGLFEILMTCIRWMTAAYAALTVVLLIIAMRSEPAKSTTAAAADA